MAIKTVVFKEEGPGQPVANSPRTRAIMEAAFCRAMVHPHVVRILRVWG